MNQTTQQQTTLNVDQKLFQLVIGSTNKIEKRVTWTALNSFKKTKLNFSTLNFSNNKKH